MRLIERFLLRAEDSPWSIFYRVGIGFLLLPAFLKLGGGAESVSRLLLFFVAVLFSFRVIPMIVRRLLPFSTDIRAAWAERRFLAKRYDSYQWQKLLGFGIGLFLYMAVSHRSSLAGVIVAGACLVCGSVGLFFWRRRNRARIEQKTVASPPYGIPA